MAKLKKVSIAKRKDGTGHTVQARPPRKPPSNGNNIRNWRLFRGIAKQEDLAHLTIMNDPKGKGLDRVCITRLENGEARYNERHLAILSRALRVAPRDLIGTNPFDAGDIFAVYVGLSESKKRIAAKLIASLKG